MQTASSTAPNAAPAPTSYRLHRKPGSAPLIGDLLTCRADHIAFLEACSRTGADIVEFDLCTRKGFAVFNPEAVREILVEDNDAWLRKGNLETASITSFLGRGVLTTDGDAWLDYKRLNAPAFARAAVENMQTLIDDSLDRSFAEWVPSGRAARRLFDDFLKVTVTATTAGFLSLRPDEDEQRALQEALLSGPELIFKMARNRATWLRRLPLPGAIRANRATRAVEALVRRNVERRKQEGSAGRADLLDLVLQYRHPRTGKALTNTEVRDQLITAVIAAPENLATTLAWAAYALQEHPAVLAKLRQSLALGETDYLRAVVDETMRRYAATPMIDRTAARDVVVGGVFVPKGSLVMIPILALHNHPAYWDAPEEFRPERWLSGKAPRAFFPFGHGPRKCIGERLGRAVVEAALKRFVTTFEWSRSSVAEPGVETLINLRPADHMAMSVARRPRD